MHAPGVATVKSTQMALYSGKILIKATAAEFLGTALFLFITISAVTGYGAGVLAPIGVAAVFGLTIFCLEIGLGETCGGHFNPAVSLGVFITGGMGYLQFVAYWVAQVLGAITGACFARLCVGDRVYEVSSSVLSLHVLSCQTDHIACLLRRLSNGLGSGHFLLELWCKEW